MLGKAFLPSADVTVFVRPTLPEQQPHPAGWLLPSPPERDERGAWALRSLTSWARRVAAGKVDSAGAVISTRGEGSPQWGQSLIAWDSRMGRNVVNSLPQS